MTITNLHAVAVVALWKTRQFDTQEIAGLLHVPEPYVVQILDIARAAEEPAAFTVVGE